MNRGWGMRQMGQDRLHSLASSERHRGRLDDADGVSVAEYGCGDEVIFFIKVENERLTKVRYLLKGCRNLAACCSAVAALAEGREVWDAMLINPSSVESAVGELPAEERHAAEYVAEAFYGAIRNYQQRHKSSLSKGMLGSGWRSLYIQAQKPFG